MRFTIDRLTRRIAELRDLYYAIRVPLDEWRVRRAPVADGAAPSLDDSGWETARLGQGFRGPRERFWFRRRVVVPPEVAGKAIALNLRLVDQKTIAGAEALVYVDGQPVQGIDRNHFEVLLTESAEAGREYAVAIYGFVGMFGETLVLERAELVAIDRAAEDYYFGALAALQVVEVLDPDSLDRVRLLSALDESENLIDWRFSGSAEFYASIARANAHLRSAVYERPPTGPRPKVILVGHSHIDVAWLWTLAVTREKCGRTFSTVLKLMEQYPEYRFTQSQPQLYDYTKQDHPELYGRIRQRIGSGEWEATGGMWVEADCNVTGAESLVRQFLYGRRFFRDELGKECRTLWLPDVFGYNWALPQLIKGAGMDYFMTTKISWSQYNQPVNDTFYWQGIDGSKVLTHFITTPASKDWWFKTYNGMVDAESVKATWDEYRQKDINDEVLLAFGYGDGGGGPTKEMLETARRLKSLPGVPDVEMCTADDFFARLEQRLQGKRVPAWNGELYMEYHRGTYTAQARNKRANRQSEALYHSAELFGCLAGLAGAAYPRATLDEGWRLILLNQFHDIIPGSSIGEVYVDSMADYARIAALGEGALQPALRRIASQVAVPNAGLPLVVFNPTSFDRTDVVVAVLPDGASSGSLVDLDGRAVLTQPTTLADGRRGIVFEATDAPANGYTTYRWLAEGTAPSADSTVAVNGLTFENGFYRAEFDDCGEIVALYDKAAQRSVLPNGARANVLQAYEDKSLRFDAWDVDIFYQDKPLDLGRSCRAEVVERGPVRATLRVEREFSRSKLVQLIHFYAQTPRIDFVTLVDWQEKHTILKAAFPVDIRAAEATYEIQWGNVGRPTHWNTSWDWARFETCAHKWVDLSEGDYGVSLLNDCKYGHDIRDNVIRVTLLRAPVEPDPHADEGEHRFTYSLYPHRESWRNGTLPEAYGLNAPLVPVWSEAKGVGVLPPSYSLVRSSRPNVIVETVKRAEDDDSLIVRVYEAYNQRGAATLTFATGIASAEEVNLIEERVGPVEHEGQTLRFFITPYQIRSFRVRLGEGTSVATP